MLCRPTARTTGLPTTVTMAASSSVWHGTALVPTASRTVVEVAGKIIPFDCVYVYPSTDSLTLQRWTATLCSFEQLAR
jgi:hypothetical protein